MMVLPTLQELSILEEKNLLLSKRKCTQESCWEPLMLKELFGLTIVHIMELTLIVLQEEEYGRLDWIIDMVLVMELEAF